MRLLLAFLLLIAPALAVAATEPATLVRVHKARHTLTVYVGDKVVAVYPVGLGVNAVGAKQQEGDRRTPEGHYVLDYKNGKSAYYLSIHISYPNAEDRAAARRRGVAPGGAIMIHGQPNDPWLRERVRAYPFPDWTDGCIALKDADMKALWDRIRVPTPIEILP